MSGRCLESVWKVSGRCPESVRCLEGVWKVPGRCLEGVWKVSRSCLGVNIFFIKFFRIENSKKCFGFKNLGEEKNCPKMFLTKKFWV